MPLNVATDLVYDWYDLGKLGMASLGLDSCLDGCVGSFFPSCGSIKSTEDFLCDHHEMKSLNGF